MEIAGVFDAGIINRLPTTTTTAASSISISIHKLLYLYDIGSLFTLAAVLFAAFATFSGLIRRSTKISVSVLFTLIKRKKRILPSPPDYVYSSDDGDSDDSCCSCDSNTEEEEEEKEDNEDFNSEEEEEEDADDKAQNWKLERLTFWPQLDGGGVVKFWDSLGIGNDPRINCMSLIDLERSQIVKSFSGMESPVAAFMASSTVVVSASSPESMKAWDSRLPGTTPTISSGSTAAEPRRRTAAGIAGDGNGEVYVKDKVGNVAVVDFRRLPPAVG